MNVDVCAMLHRRGVYIQLNVRRESGQTFSTCKLLESVPKFPLQNTDDVQVGTVRDGRHPSREVIEEPGAHVEGATDQPPPWLQQQQEPDEGQRLQQQPSLRLPAGNGSRVRQEFVVNGTSLGPRPPANVRRG